MPLTALAAFEEFPSTFNAKGRLADLAGLRFVPPASLFWRRGVSQTRTRWLRAGAAPRCRVAKEGGEVCLKMGGGGAGTRLWMVEAGVSFDM